MGVTAQTNTHGPSRKPPHLIGWTPDVRGKILEFSGERILVGSGSAVNFRIGDSLVSRRHAELLRQSDGRCGVKDLGSRNGTRVNDKKLLPEQLVELRHGDFVFFAQQGFRFDNGAGLLTNRKLAWWCLALVVALLAVLATVGLLHAHVKN